MYALIKDKKDNVKFKNFKNISVINGNVQNIKLIKKIITNSNKNNSNYLFGKQCWDKTKKKIS